MLENLKISIIKFLDFFHIIIFKTRMGVGTKNFLKNIGYTTFGNIGYTFFLFFVNLVAVRVLGPEEYGKYILVASITSFLEIPMFMGIQTSITKYLPESYKDSEKRMKIMSTAFWSIASFIFLSTLFFFIFKNFFSSIFGLPEVLFIFSLIYSILNVFQILAGSVLKGLHEFKKLAFLQVFYAIIIFISFFVIFFVTELKTYHLYIYSILIGLIFYIFYFFLTNYRNFLIEFFDKQYFKILLKYGWLNVLNSFSWFVIFSSDKFFINKFTGTMSVGIYAVYSSASMILINKGFSPFLGVFFPTVSAISNKSEINYRLNKLIKILFFPFLIINFFLMYIMFKIYGTKYPINFFWFILFSSCAVLYAISQIKWNLIISSGMNALKSYAKYSFLGAIFNLGLNYFLIKKYGIWGAALTNLLVSLFFLLSASFWLKNHTIYKEDEKLVF